MASATKKKKEDEAKGFRDQQARKAAAQGATSSNAVPEQRPQASQEHRPDLESETFRRRQEAGEFEPPTKEAYDRAASDAQAKKAAKQSVVLGNEMFSEGQRVKILTGIYEGAEGVVMEVNYASPDEAQKASSGDPSRARTARAESYLVRTRGSANALTTVKPDDLEAIKRLSGVNTRGA